MKMRSALKTQCQTPQQDLTQDPQTPERQTQTTVLSPRYHSHHHRHQTLQTQQTLQQTQRQNSIIGRALTQQLSHEKIESSLNSFASGLKRWRTGFVIVVIALIVIVGIGLYLWNNQNKKISEISKELKKARRDSSVTRQENKEAFLELQRTVISRSEFKKPPRLIVGHLI